MHSTLTASPASNTSIATHHSKECLNCGHEVPDRFCSHCGQDAHHTHRLTMADMLHDIPHSIWHVDKGILFTLKTMVLRPGPTIRAYLAGKRVDHFRPLSLLLVVTSLYAFIASMLHIQMMPPKDPSIPDAVWKMQQISTDFLTKYLSWCYIAMVPVWALFARLFLRRGGYNYAECLIIVAFITAINNFFSLLYLPVTYTYSGTHQIQSSTYVLMGVVIAYASWAYSSLLTNTKLGLLSRLWRGFLTYMLGYITCVVVMVTFTYALNWSTVKEAMKQEIQKQATAAKQASTSKPAATPQPR